jgi:hypothetical protein
VVESQQSLSGANGRGQERKEGEEGRYWGVWQIARVSGILAKVVEMLIDYFWFPDGEFSPCDLTPFSR